MNIHISGSISSSKLALKFFRLDAGGRRDEARGEENAEDRGEATGEENGEDAGNSKAANAKSAGDAKSAASPEETDSAGQSVEQEVF